MKIFKELLYSLLVILLATSCVEERIPSGAQIADVPCVLNAAKSALSFSAQGATGELEINSKNVPWELTGAPEWLTVSQTSGTGTATVTVTVAGNKDVDNARVALLQLKSTTAKYEFSKSITVTQEAAAKYINVDRTSLSFAPQAAQTSVVVSANVEWEAACSAGWLTLSKTDAATLSVAAGENTTAGSRTATITLRRVGTTQALATISVVQSEAGVTGSIDNIAFDVNGGTKSVDIEADVAWNATSSQASWLTVTPTSGDGGKVGLEITALANKATASRSGFVYVNIGSEQKLAIPVSQEGISLSVNGMLNNFAADGSTEQKLTVESNTAWAVLSCPEWLTVTPEQGNGGSTEISLQAAENNSLNPRSATLRIGVEGVTVYKDIVVEQEGVVIDLGDRSLDFGWESSQREIEITFPGDWGAMVSDDWLSLSQYSGSGGETVVVTASTNDGEDGRQGTITMASEGKSFKISVIQQGQYLKINSTAGEVSAMGGSVSLTVTTSVGATAVVEYEGDAKDWITFGSDDDGVYTLQVAYNPSIGSRTAQFVIKPTMSVTNTTCTSGVKFAVTQKGRALSANVSEIAIFSAGGKSETYTVTADSTYTITKPESDNWYTLQHDAAKGTFYIIVTENTTGVDRTSQITASLTCLPSGEEHGIDIQVVQYNEFNGHEYVDLGLPSGLKWATCNVGASKPEEDGGYYAWGETEEKDNYSWSTYKWCKGSYDTMTKYCTSSSNGTVDNRTTLDPEDDVAHVKWGGDWRVPAKEELDELREKCTWSWTTQDGIKGYKVTSKTNGNSIFLPAVGYRDGTGLDKNGTYGYYWSGSLNNSCYYANDLFFAAGSRDCDFNYRYYGLTVRPVCGDALKYTVSVSSAGNGNCTIKDKNGTLATVLNASTNTVIATPAEGYAFSGWYVNGNAVSTQAEYTFTVSENITLVARFEEANLPSGSVAGHDYVDLGLPSGLKWATCNVGASKPWEYGGIYAWGELNTKYYYEKNNSTTYLKDISDISGNPNYDVARADWGDSWRMPTKTECDELVSNCTWKKDTLNGIDGYKVTSNMNGKSIFLPAAGWRADAKSYEEGEKVNIWSSTPYSTTYVSSAYHIAVDPVCTGFSACYYGMSVRPVCGDVATVAWYTVSVSCETGGSVAIKEHTETAFAFEEGSAATVVATPDEGYAFSGWYVNGNAVSTDAEYTFTVSEDVALVAKFKKEYLSSGSLAGHEYVDLGLPSGVKWATCNVGAFMPEESGGYYAWGETEEKENYDLSTYKWCNGSYDTMTKYCTSSSYGTVDNKTLLAPEDDVAHVKWGSTWRMPTQAELNELCNNCTWSLTTENGVEGYRATSKTNGNSIFLPAAGYRLDSEVSYRGSRGHYWSSSLCGHCEFAFAFRLLTTNYRVETDIYNKYRIEGYSVRPVFGGEYTISVGSEGNGSVAINGNSGTSATFETGASVTVVATPDEGYLFEGWFVGNALVSTDAEYTFTVSEDVALVAKFKEEYLSSGSLAGHEYVDLGLPSGLKWATCNVGASSPEDYGGYYAWGETEEKDNYSRSTYKWCNGSETTFTKYCTDSTYGIVDNNTVLDPEDDVAHVKWGGSWRMPTEAELYELCNNCTWSWTTENGVEGHRVTSKTNGNSIFLPASGDCSGTEVNDRGSYGSCWSSSLCGGTYCEAIYFYLGPSDRYGRASTRSSGYPVRPVFGDAWYAVIVGCKTGGGSVAIKEHTKARFAFEEGSVATVVATPNEGYAFSGWYVNGNALVSTDAEYTFTVSEDVEMMAKFEQTVYTISVGCETGGNVAINGNSGTSATFETGVSVTVVATPDEGYAFSGWHVGDVNAVSTDAEYTFTVSEDVELVAKFTKIMNEINGHEYVDLGLPSGLKWATCNVGASAPEEYGGYYAWGETEEKENYDFSTYKWCNGSETTMTKYCTDSSYGTVDNKTVLDPEDDVAHVKWGGTWRMPTVDEQDELLNNCTWDWTTQNGVNGYRVTSKTNGNSIFLPAAGCRGGTEVQYRGSYGYCWSSSLYSSESNCSCSLNFASDGSTCGGDIRYAGLPVRPVSK